MSSFTPFPSYDSLQNAQSGCQTLNLCARLTSRDKLIIDISTLVVGGGSFLGAFLGMIWQDTMSKQGTLALTVVCGTLLLISVVVQLARRVFCK
jgi:hypothetical protein